MNKTITSEEKIVAAALHAAKRDGIDQISIRTVAKECGIAVGSIYNYFPAKADLVIAVVEKFWKDIFSPLISSLSTGNDFTGIIHGLYQAADASLGRHQRFFNGHPSLISSKHREKGRHVMEQYFLRIQEALTASLKADKKINQSIWSPSFTPEAFSTFIFSNTLSALSKGENNYEYLQQLIQRILY